MIGEGWRQHFAQPLPILIWRPAANWRSKQNLMMTQNMKQYFVKPQGIPFCYSQ